MCSAVRRTLLALRCNGRLWDCFKVKSFRVLTSHEVSLYIPLHMNIFISSSFMWSTSHRSVQARPS